MAPVSFAVLLLKLTGTLDLIAGFCEPLFVVLGMPGEAAVVFATSCLLNIYSCVAVIETFDFSARTVTILALMCAIAHSLPVENAVQKKAGSSAFRMIVLRLTMSFVAAFVLNILMPVDTARATVSRLTQNETIGIGSEVFNWFVDIVYLSGKILLIIITLMILQRILEEFGAAKLLARGMKYPIMILGLSRNAAFTWIVAYTVGLAYGAGFIIDQVSHGHISREEADYLNHHMAISHALLEDTALLLAAGASLWWITVPRILMAGIVVWMKRLIDRSLPDGSCRILASAKEGIHS